MNSRMPDAKMRSIGAASCLCPAALCSSLRLVPDQNSRSKSSLSLRTRFSPNSLPKITVQLASETINSPTITSCTTKLACSTSVKIDMSWVIAGFAGFRSECAGA